MWENYSWKNHSQTVMSLQAERSFMTDRRFMIIRLGRTAQPLGKAKVCEYAAVPQKDADHFPGSIRIP